MKNIIAYSDPKNDIVKRYIEIKDAIVSLSDGTMKSVIITSPKEDKVHADLSANLAVVMSKSGYKTLVIDSNIENGILDKIFEIKSDIGLTDYVLKDQSLNKVIRETEIGNLNVITTGKQEIDVLGNKKLEYLIEECKKQFDYIIINGPSTLNSNGAQVLAKYCDGIVIVVEHENTELENVKKVQAKLERFKEKIVGVVLSEYNEY